MRKFSGIALVGLAFHVAVAVWNGFWGPSIGADLDAVTFHDSAEEVATGKFEWDRGYGVNVYVYAIGQIYSVFGPHVFLSSMLSVIAWLLGSLVLARCLSKFELAGISSRTIGIWFLAVSPSILINTSVQLREGLQFMFLALVAFGQFRCLVERRRSGWVWMLIGAVGATSLHGGLFVPSIAGMALTLFFGQERTKTSKIVAIGLSLFVALCGIFLFYSFGADLGGNLVAAVSKYQEGLSNTEGRTNYLIFSEFDSVLDLALKLPTFLAQYFLEPLPWREMNLGDMVIFCENIVRLSMIFFAIRNYFRSGRDVKGFLAASILTFLVCEGVWSLGTGNWGTAARHHVPSIALLIVAASVKVPLMSRKIFESTSRNEGGSSFPQPR